MKLKRRHSRLTPPPHPTSSTFQPPTLPSFSLSVCVVFLLLTSFFASHSKCSKTNKILWLACLPLQATMISYGNLSLNILKCLDNKMKYFLKKKQLLIRVISYFRDSVLKTRLKFFLKNGYSNERLKLTKSRITSLVSKTLTSSFYVNDSLDGILRLPISQ